MSTKRAIWLANAALLILSSATLIGIAAKDGLGSFDFHCFWYGGNLIWQGTDPYRAFIEKQKVELPINYIDSVTVAEGPIDPFDRQCAPGNAAPVLFFLSPLARLSWEAAHNTWFILNILFALMIGGTLLRIVGRPAASSEGILLFCLIMLQLSTRETLELGQTSLLITLCTFAAMLLSYRKRTRLRAIASGIFLGLAISKPLLSFPLFLLFVFRRRILELLVAAFIQIAGIAGIVLMETGVSVVLEDYFRIFMMHAGPGTQDGVYLTAGLLKGWMPYSYIIIGAGSIFLGVILFRWWSDRAKSGKIDIKTDLVLLTVLMLWNLLVFYHRRYDYVAAISFLALAVYLPAFPFRMLSLSFRRKLGIYGTAIIAIAVWILPFYLVMGEAAYRSLFNIATLAALSLSTWLLFRSIPGRASP